MAANHDATIAEFAEKLRTGTMTPADMNKRLAVAAVSAFLDEAPKNGRPGYTLLTAVASALAIQLRILAAGKIVVRP